MNIKESQAMINGLEINNKETENNVKIKVRIDKTQMY